ncbi:hypothetical protein [Crateriforma conspicua]|uniref:hypothetical protein n=1 Tax=Crateriforma conspicua TaxID=2527996 RepID=UPI00118C8095|nr:hypothetical protein [Crateriforma conspicua]QDV65675.1 hypothetical protein Mal65_48480 [Crateriforma conspicua]
MPPRPSRRRFLAVVPFCFLVTAVVLAGCDNEASVRTYTIPTTVPPQLQSSPQRMLAVMVPVDQDVWFYKIQGPADAIGGVEADFKDFVKARTYVDNAPDLSELPEGWRRGGEKPFRFASIDINTPDKQLDLSISKLTAGDDWDQFVVMNVNRWRGQVGLPDSDERWAGGTAFDVDAVESDAVLADLVGDGDAGTSGMSMPPFAGATASGSPDSGDPHASLPPEMRRRIAEGQMPDPSEGQASGSGESSEPKQASADSEADNPSKLKFERPEGWRDGRMSMMRMAAFEAGEDDAKAEITVITAGGDLRSNVARWLGQVIGGQPTDEAVDAAMDAADDVTVDGRDGKRFLLRAGGESDPDQMAIDAVIVPLESGFSLFVKMTGPESTVMAERDSMGSFVQSLSF